MEILVIGHKNPDTDSICSAIAYSELKNKLGQNTKPVRAGDLNKETEFVMDDFKSEIPALNPDISGRDVILVDHNERTQTADGFEGAKILELISNDPAITTSKLANMLFVTRKTISTHMKIMKKNNVIERIGSDRKGYWKIL